MPTAVVIVGVLLPLLQHTSLLVSDPWGSLIYPPAQRSIITSTEQGAHQGAGWARTKVLKIFKDIDSTPPLAACPSAVPPSWRRSFS